jgi:membrane associated rhomboid family serine protease
VRYNALVDEGSEDVVSPRGPSDAKDANAEERAKLDQRLRALTPRTPGMWAIVAVNLAVFVAMLASGVDPLIPDKESLVAWGANHGSRVSEGEWWRLFTSMFLSYGAIGIAVNTGVLWTIGRFIERALGTRTFLVIYLLSGWAGGVAVRFFKPVSISAGPSGAISGVFGVMLAFVVRPRRSVPPSARRLWVATLLFLLYTLDIGYKSPDIALPVQLGGFVTGALLGIALCHELTPEARLETNRRTALLGAVAAVALGAATWTLRGRTPDLATAIGRLGAAEQQVMARYNDSRERVLAGKETDNHFVDILEHEIMPAWRAARLDLALYRDYPPEARELAASLDEYWLLREEGWELLASAFRAQDTGLMQKALAVFTKANARHDEISANIDVRAAELGFPKKKLGFTPTTRNP